MPSLSLTGTPLRTYQAFTGNAPAPNADWNEVRALLAELGQVTTDSDGNLTINQSGRVLTLHPALTKDVAQSGEAIALRRFLQEAEARPVAAASRDPHLLLLLHENDARLFRCQVIGGRPQLILPYQPETPEAETATEPPASGPNSLFTSLAEQLQVAGQIVIFSTGAGNEAAVFAAWLGQHDSALSGRIIGTAQVDPQQLDLTGLLTAARAFYATLPPRH